MKFSHGYVVHYHLHHNISLHSGYGGFTGRSVGSFIWCVVCLFQRTPTRRTCIAYAGVFSKKYKLKYVRTMHYDDVCTNDSGTWIGMHQAITRNVTYVRPYSLFNVFTQTNT